MYIGGVVESREIQLEADIYPEDAKNKKIKWESDNKSVATVDDNGKITAKWTGKATITVTTEDGKFTDTCEVKVSEGITIREIIGWSIALIEAIIGAIVFKRREKKTDSKNTEEE